jgi:bifunctional UDP-N-acetylglucosamine pyrophosphorylase/glucosamine-1-phosphate N-acetyltransferase
LTAAIILAAGQGKRMHSDLPKVMHPVLGRPMLIRVIETAAGCGFQRIVTVIGYGRQHLIPLLDAGGFEWAVQEKQMGTAHAVSSALSVCRADEYMVLLGDVPLLRPRTILDVLSARRESGAAVAVLTGMPPDPSGYGRIIRGRGAEILRIVEERDATPAEKSIPEINTGVMAFDGTILESLLERVESSNSQGEFYLTDTIPIAFAQGRSSMAVPAGDWLEVAGVNDPFQLAEASRQQCRRVLENLMAHGVSFDDPASVWIEDTVEIGAGTHVGRLVKITGSSSIGSSCSIGDGCIVAGGIVPDGTLLKPYTVLELR